MTSRPLVSLSMRWTRPTLGVGGIIEGIILQVVGQRIDQRAGIIAVPRVDDEPRRLVDDHQHLIFVDDIQGNGLGDDLKLVLGTA